MISRRIIDICSSDLDWANPGGQPTAAGMYLVATATFTGLPANNSDFGLKQAAIYFGNRNQPRKQRIWRRLCEKVF